MLKKRSDYCSLSNTLCCCCFLSLSLSLSLSLAQAEAVLIAEAADALGSLQSSMEPPSRMAGPGTRYWLSLCQSDTRGEETVVEVGGNRRGFQAALTIWKPKELFPQSLPWISHSHTHLQHKQTPRVCSCSCCCWGGTRKRTLTQLFPSKVSVLLFFYKLYSPQAHTHLSAYNQLLLQYFSSHKRCFTISKTSIYLCTCILCWKPRN